MFSCAWRWSEPIARSPLVIEQCEKSIEQIQREIRNSRAEHRLGGTFPAQPGDVVAEIKVHVTASKPLDKQLCDTSFTIKIVNEKIKLKLRLIGVQHANYGTLRNVQDENFQNQLVDELNKILDQAGVEVEIDKPNSGPRNATYAGRKNFVNVETDRLVLLSEHSESVFPKDISDNLSLDLNANVIDFVYIKKLTAKRGQDEGEVPGSTPVGGNVAIIGDSATLRDMAHELCHARGLGGDFKEVGELAFDNEVKGDLNVPIKDKTIQENEKEAQDMLMFFAAGTKGTALSSNEATLVHDGPKKKK